MKSFYTSLVFILIVFGLKAQWLQMGVDIDGEAANDRSGYAVSISSDGNTIAIGAATNNGNGIKAGHVRVFDWDGTAWIQRGMDIDGEAAGDEFGISVALSSNGLVLASGALYSDGNGVNAGHVRVFNWNGSMWQQLGGDIDGEAAGDKCGESISLSADGYTLAVGALSNDGNGNWAGHARVFVWDGTTWQQRGADLDGEAPSDYFGTVSLNSDGQTLAVGASSNSGSANQAGHVRVFTWDGLAWVQKGMDIDGEAAGDYSGSSVSLSADGNIVAIGAPMNDGLGFDSGHTRVYLWDGSSWIQMGLDIDGENSDDRSGMSVHLTPDGKTLAVGAVFNDGSVFHAGHVRIFSWIDSAWQQQGQDIDGEAIQDNSSESEISADGKTIIIGAFLNDGNGTSSGHARVYRYLEEVNQISGNIYLDFNSNNLPDNGESGFTDGNLLSAGHNVYGKTTGIDGYFTISCDTGMYVVSFKPFNNDYFDVALGPYISQFDTLNLIDTLSFPVQLIPGHPDLQINLFPLGPARPGFDLTYRLVAKNVGTDSLNGSVTLYIDDSLSLNTTIPLYDSYQNDSVSWFFTDFAPFEEMVYDVFLGVWPSVALGSDLSSSAVIRPVTGDEHSTDNYSSLRQSVIGSYDPNDKWVSHEFLNNQDIADTNFLTYRIRFQNTGTDTAFTVVVKDTLDINLDWSSIQMLHASHPWEMTYRQERFIEWNFPNILLPDSNVNEPGSHGYILYRIRPKSTLLLGDEIHNSCSIYFDFNAPIKTNTVVTQVFYGAHVSTDQSAYCEGDSIYITVRHEGEIQSGNLTHVIFSDESGSFVNGDTLTSVMGDTAFYFIIPDQITAGNGYLLKAVTSIPFTDGQLRTVNLSIDTLPISTIYYSGLSNVCTGQQVIFTAPNSVGYQYQWLRDGQSISGANMDYLSVNTSGNYQLVMSNNCGSDTSTIQTITVHSDPVAIISLNSGLQEFCESDSLPVYGTFLPGGQHQWMLNGSPVPGATDSLMIVSVPGNYQLIVSNFCGSDTSQPIQISEVPLPDAQITSNLPIEFCEGESAILNAATGNGYQYQWFNMGNLLTGEINSDLSVTTSGQFNALVSNQCGTDTSDEVTVSVHPLPIVTFDTSFIQCQDQDDIILSGGEPLGGNYSGTGVNSNSFSANAAGVGTHNVRYIYVDTNGCSDTAWAQAIVHSLPLVTFDTSYTFCHDQSSFTLVGGQPLGGNYSGTGVTNNSFSATTAGIGTHNISYSYIDSNGCSDTAWAQIEVEVCGAIASPPLGGRGVLVGPNPTDEIIYVEWKGSGEAEVRVWSTNGKLMTQQLITAHSTFRIESWPAGVHIIEVRNSDQVWRKKVVVE